MKGTNQFDYPTATATNYKAYRDEFVPKADKKDHYKRVIKQESQNERDRVKNQQQRKKQQEALEQQNRIKEEIERKKRELQQLERKKQEAMQNQRRAFELAKIKDEQDKIKRVQQQQKMKQYDENANFRFKDALKRLQIQKEQSSYKERQAMQRRKVNQQIEKQQREKAIKYKTYLTQKEQSERMRALQQKKTNQQLYRNGVIKHGLAKNIDYSKTCFHNPKLVFKYDNEETQVSAFKKGEEESKRQKELSSLKRQKSEQSRKRSLERGEKALERIQSSKEYRAYERQAEQQQKKYNMQRIQAGKKNQYTGLKPLTLNQMEINKKAKGEEQFEDMFIKSSEVPLYNHDYATKYTIMEAKYNPIPQNNYSRWKETQREEEDSLQIYNPSVNFTKYAQENHSDDELELREITEVPQPIRESIDRSKAMAETRAGEAKNYQKEQLSYSESEDDSSYL